MTAKPRAPATMGRKLTAQGKKRSAAVLGHESQNTARPESRTAKSAVKTPPFETCEQLLQRILTERRRNWQGRGSFEEPSAPDTSGAETMSDQHQFLLYTAPNGAVKVDVVLKDETVWLTQKALAELFAVQVPGINKHLKNIFDSGELVEDSVISILETTATDGKNYQSRYYKLDAIIAVGYRVNSFQATQFRIWATKTLREFMIKGFVLDDERLKQGKQVFGKDYFDELLERIRDIRSCRTTAKSARWRRSSKQRRNMKCTANGRTPTTFPISTERSSG